MPGFGAAQIPICVGRHASPICCRSSLNKADGDRVTIKFSVACLDGSDNHQNGVQDPENCEEKEANQHETENCGDGVVDEHRDLEVDRFFAVGVELGRVVALGQPDN